MTAPDEITTSADPTGTSVEVPAAESRDDPPPGPHSVIWEYLKPDACMRRCVEILEVLSVDHGHQTLKIDVDLPAGARSPCFVPAAYFGKRPIAPDLEAFDGTGNP